MVENRLWTGAIIRGPAVVSPVNNIQFIHCAFEASAEATFLVIPDGQPLMGIVGLRNVSFKECRFRGIRIAVTPENHERFRHGLRLNPQPTLSPGGPDVTLLDCVIQDCWGGIRVNPGEHVRAERLTIRRTEHGIDNSGRFEGPDTVFE